MAEALLYAKSLSKCDTRPLDHLGSSYALEANVYDKEMALPEALHYAQSLKDHDARRATMGELWEQAPRDLGGMDVPLYVG